MIPKAGSSRAAVLPRPALVEDPLEIDADWFNALGLTEPQLKAVRPETLRMCPTDVPAMHRYLRARYGLPFESWSARVQAQLRAAWNEYLSPDGLRDLVAVSRRKH